VSEQVKILLKSVETPTSGDHVEFYSARKFLGSSQVLPSHHVQFKSRRTASSPRQMRVLSVSSLLRRTVFSLNEQAPPPTDGVVPQQTAPVSTNGLLPQQTAPLSLNDPLNERSIPSMNGIPSANGIPSTNAVLL
jgi:hypothetical protein